MDEYGTDPKEFAGRTDAAVCQVINEHWGTADMTLDDFQLSVRAFKEMRRRGYSERVIENMRRTLK